MYQLTRGRPSKEHVIRLCFHCSNIIESIHTSLLVEAAYYTPRLCGATYSPSLHICAACYWTEHYKSNFHTMVSICVAKQKSKVKIWNKR